jgi:hypothetical protein
LTFFQVLGLDPSVDSDQAIIQAASFRMRKVREFAKGGTQDYAREMERLIIQARNALNTAAGRQQYRAQIGAAGPAAAQGEEELRVAPAPQQRTAYDKAKPSKQKRSKGKIFLLVLVVLIIIAIIIIWRLGFENVREGGSDLLDQGTRAVRDIAE